MPDSSIRRRQHGQVVQLQTVQRAKCSQHTTSEVDHSPSKPCRAVHPQLIAPAATPAAATHSAIHEAQHSPYQLLPISHTQRSIRLRHSSKARMRKAVSITVSAADPSPCKRSSTHRTSCSTSATPSAASASTIAAKMTASRSSGPGSPS